MAILSFAERNRIHLRCKQSMAELFYEFYRILKYDTAFRYILYFRLK
jgi:hypothetical protein